MCSRCSCYWLAGCEVFIELFIPDPQRVRIPFMVDLVAEWPAAVYLTFQRPLRSWQRTPAPCFRREMPPRPSHCEGGRTRWRESGAHFAITLSFLLSEPPERQISSSLPGNRFPLSRIWMELLTLPGGWFLTSSQPDRKDGPTAAVEVL